MKNLLKLFGIIALTAIIGFSFVTCDNGGDDDGDGNGSSTGNGNSNGNGDGGGNGKWRISRVKSYGFAFQSSVVGEPAAPIDGYANNSDSVYNWIMYSYTSDTNYETKCTITNNQTINQTSGTQTITSSQTNHQTRNGQNLVVASEYTSESSNENVTGTATVTTTSTTTLDSASGLTLTYTSNDNRTTTTTYSGNTTTNTTASTTEYSYNIDLISDSGGVKTYKVSFKSYTGNGNSLDVSTLGYQEYKIQNGRTLETKVFTADGVLSKTTTYTLTDNAVIRAKLGNYSLYTATAPGSSNGIYNEYTTVEVLSDSATELVVREKTFWNNALALQQDITYEKVN